MIRALLLILLTGPAMAGDARFVGTWDCRSDHAELASGKRVSGFTRSFRLILLADGTFIAEGRQTGYGTFRSFGPWQVRGDVLTARGAERGGLGPGLFTLMLRAQPDGTLLDVWEMKDSRGRVTARTADSCTRGPDLGYSAPPSPLVGEGWGGGPYAASSPRIRSAIRSPASSSPTDSRISPGVIPSASF